MAYAIFYCHSDLAKIAANVSATLANGYDQYLTTQERNKVKQTFQRAWVGGLSAWETAPVAPPEHQDSLPPSEPTLIVVVSGSQVTLKDLRDALYLLGAKVPNCQYMNAIGDDLGGWNGAVEPWP